MKKFPNREAAGQVLAELLKNYHHRSDVIVLALPRGGVPVAHEITQKLELPLDVFIVRKLGVPGHEELAMGALATGGTIVFNEDVKKNLHVSSADVQAVITAEKNELERREKKYRGNRVFPKLSEKTIILVDDGIATGATMTAAVQALRQFHPKEIIMAIPVCEAETFKKMALLVDKIICPLKPTNFYAVGQWYDEFAQTTDQEVIDILSH